MNKQIEALKMAIEFIERHVEADEYDWLIQACKEALAEAEKQEIGEAEIRQMLKEIEWCHQELEKKEWQSLSDGEKQRFARDWDSRMELVDAIEAKLKEKNKC